jgi:hypothetical protein
MDNEAKNSKLSHWNKCNKELQLLWALENTPYKKLNKRTHYTNIKQEVDNSNFAESI